MEPLIVGAGSGEAETLYLLGVLAIMFAGLVLIIRTKGVFVVLLLLGIVALAIGSVSPGRRSYTEPIPISPVAPSEAGGCRASGLPHHARYPSTR